MNVYSKWFEVLRVGGNYNTMHYFAGTGGDTFDINFAGGYLDKAHVKAISDDGGLELSLTFITKSRVKLSRPIAKGGTVLIFRDTPKVVPLALFNDGAVMNSVNLDRNAKQAVFVAAEMLDRFDTFGASLETSVEQVSEALRIAAAAVSAADDARGVAEDALATSKEALELTRVHNELTGRDEQATHPADSIDWSKYSATAASVAAPSMKGGSSKVPHKDTTVADELARLEPFEIAASALGLDPTGAADISGKVAGKYVVLDVPGSYKYTTPVDGTYFRTLCGFSAQLLIGSSVYIPGSSYDVIHPTEQVEPDGTVVRLGNTKVGVDSAPKMVSGPKCYANTTVGNSSASKVVDDVTRLTAVGGYTCRDLINGYSIDVFGTNAMEWTNYADRVTSIGANSCKNLGNMTPVGVHEYFKPSNPNINNWDSVWPEWRTFAGAVDSPAQVMRAVDYRQKATHLVGVGRNTFGFSITAKDSCAVGYDAVTSLLYGTDVVGVGDRVLQWGIKVDFSTVLGSKAMQGTMDSLQDTVVGAAAAAKYTHSLRNTLIGYQCMWGNAALNTDKPESNTLVGRIAAANAKGSFKYCSGLGEGVLSKVEGDLNSGLGAATLNRLEGVTSVENTGLGARSLITNQDLSPATHLINVTGVGANTRASGDHQVILGDSRTTPYAQAPLQVRSDGRDKVITGNSLGIEFLREVETVEGVWDMRDDYTEAYTVQVGIDENAEPVFETRVRALPKDGSMKRTRKHQWVIAQQLEEVCNRLGVDFAGLQHHLVNGGSDVYTVGYEEFIPPIISAIKHLDSEVTRIHSRLDKLEGKEV